MPTMMRNAARGPGQTPGKAPHPPSENTADTTVLKQILKLLLFTKAFADCATGNAGTRSDPTPLLLHPNHHARSGFRDINTALVN